jgi:DNA invertase Pin-like site-specific DNA recombinase
MVEAIPSLARSQRQAQRQAHAVRVLAQQRAREEVKARLRREGRVKLSSVPSREITAMAESTDGQDLATQHELLKAAGAELVYAEKQSGVKTDRAALARCMRSLEAGDVILVTKLDRLARSTRDLLNTLATIGEAGASFRSLGDPADTTTPHGRLMLTVLGGLAEFERHLILSRTNEGRQRARGLRFGRKPKLTAHQQAEARARLAQGETLVAIARSYNVSHMTISRLAGVTFMQ